MAQLRSRRPTALPGTLTSGTAQRSNSPGSTMVGGLSTAGQATSNLHVTSASTPAQEPLHLDSTTVDGGGPEVQVGLVGGGFTSGCEVHFRVSSSRDLAVRPDWSDSGAIGVTLPADLTGLKLYNGVIYVKREDGQVSTFKPFVFRPRMDVAVVDAQSIPWQSCHPSSAALLDNSVDGSRFGHLSWALPAASGTDLIGVGCHLKNDWVVDHVELSVGWGDATLSNVHQGSDDLSFQVQWNAKNYFLEMQSVFGSYQVVARGPAGVPYK